MIDNFLKSNRENVLDKIADNSVVILFAGNSPRKSADEAYQFTPNRNFYYLSNIEEMDHIIMMSKINGVKKETLFLKDIDLEREKWDGKTLREDEAKEISKIEDIKFKSQFLNELHKTVIMSEDFNLYVDLERKSHSENDTISYDFVNNIKLKYPQANIKNVYNIISSLRIIKNEQEIEKIKKAIEITKEGIELLMKKCKPGMKEYELEAYFDFNCKSKGAKDFAFKTIAAGGKNATILHYGDNNCELKDGDLVLFDLGAQYKYYNADISRVFPVNGKFTQRQKDVYNAVLRVNEAVIDYIKPKVKFKDANEYAKDLVAEECIKLGLIDKKEDVTKYYFHSIGHSLGLDTHDVTGYINDEQFEEGIVYTVEPGIYIPEESIGVRIEDDILITKEGNENLTKHVIKTVEEIESFMN